MTHRRRPGAPPRAPRPFTADHGVTEREWQALRANAITGKQRLAAEMLGISVQTVKNLLSSARHRLQSPHIFDTYEVIGWLVIPDQPEVPEGEMPDSLLVHGHHFVHVAACPCTHMTERMDRLDAQHREWVEQHDG